MEGLRPLDVVVLSVPPIFANLHCSYIARRTWKVLLAGRSGDEMVARVDERAEFSVEKREILSICGPPLSLEWSCTNKTTYLFYAYFVVKRCPRVLMQSVGAYCNARADISIADRKIRTYREQDRPRTDGREELESRSTKLESD